MRHTSVVVSLARAGVVWHRLAASIIARAQQVCTRSISESRRVHRRVHGVITESSGTATLAESWSSQRVARRAAGRGVSASSTFTLAGRRLVGSS